jgi:hypothetical protein
MPVRLLLLFLAILGAVWLFAHPGWVMAIALAATLLSFVRVIGDGPL